MATDKEIETKGVKPDKQRSLYPTHKYTSGHTQRRLATNLEQKHNKQTIEHQVTKILNYTKDNVDFNDTFTKFKKELARLMEHSDNTS